MTAVLTPTKSFVADFIIMTATGEAFEELNVGVVNAAAEAIRDIRNEGGFANFEDVYPFLQENEWGVEYAFDCPVTEETVEAYAAYMAYAI